VTEFERPGGEDRQTVAYARGRTAIVNHTPSPQTQAVRIEFWGSVGTESNETERVDRGEPDGLWRLWPERNSPDTP
jgi:hypothetical protein